MLMSDCDQCKRGNANEKNEVGLCWLRLLLLMEILNEAH